jgi:transposase
MGLSKPPTKGSRPRQITTIGLDIARHVFQAHGVDRYGKVVRRSGWRAPRCGVLRKPAALSDRLEACGGAHHWARDLRALGHEVRLMPPQHVKLYVEPNKHDVADVEGCCQAVQRPGMRFVPIKGEIHRGRLPENTGPAASIAGSA